MSNPISCVPNCCAEPTNVDVPGPEGATGTAGTNGTDGENAFTLTTADFTVPAKGSNVTVSVASSDWMVVGQPVFIEGAGIFTVSSIPDSTHVILTYANYDNNTAAGNVIPLGSGVSPSGTQAAAAAANTTVPIGAYAAGTAYSLTTTPTLLTFGTTSPTITITTAGTWLLLARARIDYAGATFAANQLVSLKLRRRNNTAGDVTNAAAAFKAAIVTTLSHTAMVCVLPPVAYATLNATDIIDLFGSVAVLPSAGTIDAVQAEIVAVRLF